MINLRIAINQGKQSVISSFVLVKIRFYGMDNIQIFVEISQIQTLSKIIFLFDLFAKNCKFCFEKTTYFFGSFGILLTEICIVRSNALTYFDGHTSIINNIIVFGEHF